MAATLSQIRWFQNMRQICGGLGIPRSTLKHRSLQGTLTTDPITGNVVYAMPGPGVAESTADTLVWAVWRPIERGGSSIDDTPIGGIGIEKGIFQFPSIDDNGNNLIVLHQDFLVTNAGLFYRLENPMLSPDQGFWLANGERQR